MKKRVIAISIIAAIVAILGLAIIIFCSVFRIGKISISKADSDIIYTTNQEGESVELTKKQIISASGIKKGSSSLFLDKAKAQSKIEKAYPYIKVVQISLTNARTVEITVTARHEMFYYTTNNAGFFILDEELKVLRLDTHKPDNLIPINPQLTYYNNGKLETDENFLSTDANTKAGNFLGKQKYRKLFNNLYVGIYKSVLVNPDGSLWLEKDKETDVNSLLANETIRRIEREDFNSVLTGINLSVGYTKTKSFLRLTLSTKAGVKILIDGAETDLQNKINHCFSLVCSLDSLGENFSSNSGCVAYRLDGDGELHLNYEVQN